MDNNTIKGVTKSGFEYELSKDRLNNFELIEIFAEVDNNPLLLPKALTLLLGAEQKQRLYDHLRTSDDIVPADLVGQEIAEIFNSNQVKN
ncbi:hypothetical protein [Peptoanaerobacter stomatis]|uniref:hypothetical protein n=1 Tax=Peptoanaerobacter stomatis TaxID=796937 RepID=UPI003F9F4710